MVTFLHEILDVDAVLDQVQSGHIRIQTHPEKPWLQILNYTEKAQFERAWTPETLACRGLIVDYRSGQVLARPFTKFFNHDEPEAAGIDLTGPVTVTDKMDGSLGILYFDGDDWAIATRGSFASEQAIHATKLFRERYAGFVPPEGWTLLFEVVYKENRIVVDYGDTDDLFLLGAVEIERGFGVPPEAVPRWEGPRTQTFEFGSFAEALAAEPRPNAEGYVIHFHHGDVKVKFKQEDYKALHKVITGWNERTIWELLRDGKTVEDIAENLPDEFHAWATEVSDGLVSARGNVIYSAVTEFNSIDRELTEAHGEDGWSRREFAAKAKDSVYRAALFSLLDGHTEKVNKWAWDMVRPSAAKEANLVNS